jgi:hypothetical protein
MRYLKYFVFLFLFYGCASIPSEAPQLSEELGNRISAFETSNINLLHNYFSLKRNEVDKFIQNEWVPTFANELFSQPAIQAAWDTIVSENNKADRLKFLTMVGPKLQDKINQKRLELVQPLDDLEITIEQKIRDEYSLAISINNTLTSFLISAAKVDENRQRYLNMLGIKDDAINNVIDKVDDGMSDLLKGGKDVSDKVNSALVYVNKLKDLKNSLKGGK